MTTLADEFLADLEELDDDSDAEDAPTLDADGMVIPPSHCPARLE